MMKKWLVYGFWVVVLCVSIPLAFVLAGGMTAPTTTVTRISAPTTRPSVQPAPQIANAPTRALAEVEAAADDMITPQPPPMVTEFIIVPPQIFSTQQPFFAPGATFTPAPEISAPLLPTETLAPLATTPPPTSAPLLAVPTRGFATIIPPTPTATATPQHLPSPTAWFAASPTPVVETESVAASGAALANYCVDFGQPITLHLVDWATAETFRLTNSEIAQMPLRWDASNSIWRGYSAAKPFDQPDDAHSRWKLDLFLADGRERWIEIVASAETPQTVYVYAFQNLTPYADRNGEHFGFHPCRVFAIATDQIHALIDAIINYQHVQIFPPLISDTDPRWRSGVAQPTARSAHLRSLPTAENNDPIGLLTQAVRCWYALDPAWGDWAQIKLGNNHAWVHLDGVRFTEA
ncbi:MAG: hypothetical protein GYB67_00735 [Chloroflexi bacterium]|nr:hypothetical protein [Chloroflexota bacterium]